MKKTIVISLLLSIILSFGIYESRLDNLIAKFNVFIEKNYNQKVYVFTNKNNYNISENIWFSTYSVSSENILDTLSENIYVELISPESKIVYVRLLKLQKGFAYGDFPLPDSLQNGQYLLRAFTEWMKNYDSKFFFTKKLYIENPLNTKISKELFYKSKKIKQDLEDINVDFFPEGGNLVYGIETKIAFKANDILGNSVDIKGVIKDKNNNTIIEFASEHNGMGNFIFKPEAGEKYKAEIYYNNKKIKQNFAKEIYEKGYVLKVEKKENFVKINVNSKIFENNDKYNKTIYLIAQQNDKLKFTTAKVLENMKTEIEVSIDSFETGIVQFTLFNGKAEPVCERLLFINKNDYLEPNISIHKSDNNVNIEIMNIEKAKVSLSILDSKEEINSDNILSYFYLNSDLQGKVENPNYYFENTWTEKIEHEIDLVMLTNGWRKYEWETILSEEQDSLKYNYGNGITVEGEIQKIYLNLPSKETKVTMTMLDSYNDVFETVTDEKGKFRFENLYYQDSLNILVEAITKKDKDNVLVLTSKYDTIPIEYFPYSESSVKFFNKKNIEKTEYQVKTETNSGLHGTPDQVIYCDEMSGTKKNVFEIIQNKVPGVKATENGVNIRNNKSFISSSEPLYLIDDIPTDLSAVKSLNVSDVERIEIIKSMSKSAIYGSRGRNGVIAIYTKKGFNIIMGWEALKLLAYYTPKEFYQPNYENFNSDSISSAIFWKPDIETKTSDSEKIDFSTPDNLTEIRIIIQGISDFGQIVYYNKILKI